MQIKTCSHSKEKQKAWCNLSYVLKRTSWCNMACQKDYTVRKGENRTKPHNPATYSPVRRCRTKPWTDQLEMPGLQQNWGTAFTGRPSLCADSSDSLKRSEVPPPVESAEQRYKASLLISAQAYFYLIAVCLNKLCKLNPIVWRCFDFFVVHPSYGRPTESNSIRIITRIPRRCLSIN